jgi:hypothetical protein
MLMAGSQYSPSRRNTVNFAGIAANPGRGSESNHRDGRTRIV